MTTTASLTIHDDEVGQMTLAPWHGPEGGYALWHRGEVVWRSADPDIAGDAATMRGFIATHHMTPSMAVSLMYHWQRRALEAEQAVRWARPRLTKDVYRQQLDKMASLPPAPENDDPKVVQSLPVPPTTEPQG